MKRTFTFLLALVMLLSIAPTVALAAETEQTVPPSVPEAASENAVEAPEPSAEPAPATPICYEKETETRDTNFASTRSDIVATVPVQYYKKKGITPDPTVMAGTTKLKKAHTTPSVTKRMMPSAQMLP